MGRNKKYVNKSGIPQYAIERFARCVFDDIRADYAKPEVQQDFEAWKAERKRKADLERSKRSRHNGKIDAF